MRRLADVFEAGPERTERTLTQNQLQELLESDQIRAMVEGAEERGFVEPAEIEAFVAELELSDEEAEELARELERIGLEIGAPAAQAAAEKDEKAKAEPRVSEAGPSLRRRATACSSSSPTSAATSC